MYYFFFRSVLCNVSTICGLYPYGFRSCVARNTNPTEAFCTVHGSRRLETPVKTPALDTSDDKNQCQILWFLSIDPRQPHCRFFFIFFRFYFFRLFPDLSISHQYTIARKRLGKLGTSLKCRFMNLSETWTFFLLFQSIFIVPKTV